MHLDHIQLAMPPGAEDRARAFFVDLLGMIEEPKPESLRPTGGCWFHLGSCSVHLGVEDDFRPQRKAHPAFAVSDVDGLAERLSRSGSEVSWDRRIPGVKRFFTSDPFGNRIEFVRDEDALGRAER